MFASVWDAIAETPAEAALLKAQSKLLMALQEAVRGWEVSDAVASRRLGVSRAKLRDILKGRLNEFTLDELVELPTTAGLRLEINVAEAA